MSPFDQRTAHLTVFSFKEGLLSRVAHDLELRVTRFSGQVEGGMIKVVVDAGSLEVAHALKGGRADPGALSPANKAEIKENLDKAVLDAAHHPEIVFTAPLGPSPSGPLRGELRLRGQTRPVTLSVTAEGDALVGEATLHQPDFGIKPFTALLGALKVKADVRVVARVPRSALGEG